MNMHTFFKELSAEDVKELFDKIISKEIYEYSPHYSGLFYYWTDLKIDNKNNTITICKNSSHDYSCTINTEEENIFELFDNYPSRFVPYFIECKDRLSDCLLKKINKYFITNNFKDMGTLDFNLLSEDKAKKVNKLIEELGCSIETAMFWLRSYSWDYERTKKYLSSSKELTEDAKKACEEVASKLNEFAEKGFDAIIRPTDEAVKKVNDMANKFQTTYNSIVDSLKENDWSFEKVEKIFSNKQKEENNDLTVSLETKLSFDALVKTITKLPSENKIKIVKEIFASENEAFIKKLISEMLKEMGYY